VPLITLLTDFGTKDPYVGVMKGVMLSINKEARLVDITHEVEPQDVEEAAFLVEEYHPFFEGGTIHLCVVDPTVGSERRAIIIEKGGSFFVGPDNGLFSLLIDEEAKIFSIENRSFMLAQLSSTFHGRDIFAPCAAYLSTGRRPEEFGPPVYDPFILDLLPKEEGGMLIGKVVRFDRFGNAITNIKAQRFMAFVGQERFIVRVKDLTFSSLKRSYFEGDVICLFGSSLYLEFGSYRRSFREEFGVGKGEPVYVERMDG
jgi:S-adenosylmethionine hydrolase